MKPSLFILFVLTLLTGGWACQSNAQGIIVIGPQNTMIDGSIPYSVIGKYRVRFCDFKGKITFDERWTQVRSVYLKINVKSILSNCAWCDKLARSRRLLNAGRYPFIIFKSEWIFQDQDGLHVKGILYMHGIKKVMVFPFNTGPHRLYGSWNINRKDFNIIWSKVLDHGGVLVGDDLTVNWEIKLPIK